MTLRLLLYIWDSSAILYVSDLITTELWLGLADCADAFGSSMMSTEPVIGWVGTLL